MEITPKIRKLIYGMFDTMIEGADKYVTKSSMWLIFTEEKRWVIEFTNTKTLWFNYNLFQSELNLLSMDCVDSKDIIKEWFESRFLEKDIAHVTDTSNVPYSIVENTLQNGVKHTYKKKITRLNEVEDTIQNGVKNSQSFGGESLKLVEDTIKNGVKRTSSKQWENDIKVDDIIKNGVKDTGARHLRVNRKVDDAIENGVKEVKTPGDGDIESTMDFMNENNTLDVQKLLDDVIENGVKEIKHKVVESYQQKDHMVTNAIITEDINYAIENGVKE
jgi:hypothetical protein